MPDEFLSILTPSPLPPEPLPRRVGSRKIFGQFVFLILILLSAGVGALGGLVCAGWLAASVCVAGDRRSIRVKAAIDCCTGLLSLFP